MRSTIRFCIAVIVLTACHRRPDDDASLPSPHDDLVAIAPGTYRVTKLHYKGDEVCTADLIASDMGRREADVQVAAFDIDRHVVTRAEYRACVRQNACPDETEYDLFARAPPGSAIDVDLEGAEAYCKRRGMRLPTYAEWQVAMRGPGVVVGSDQGHFEWTSSLECWDSLKHDPALGSVLASLSQGRLDSPTPGLEGIGAEIRCVRPDAPVR